MRSGVIVNISFHISETDSHNITCNYASVTRLLSIAEKSSVSLAGTLHNIELSLNFTPKVFQSSRYTQNFNNCTILNWG